MFHWLYVCLDSKLRYFDMHCQVQFDLYKKREGTDCMESLLGATRAC